MNRLFPIALALCAWVLPSGAVWAADPVTAFEQANRLYEQARYAEAAAGFEQIRSNGSGSPALLFNLGNAYFKAGQTGRAIAAYREAERFTPRDPDLRANLRFARETANTRGTEAAWRRALRTLTLDEWTLGACAGLWAWLGLLAVGRLRPVWGRALALPRRIALGAFAIFAGALCGSGVDELGSRRAVVVAKEAVVRYGPLDESQSHYSLRDGAEVLVMDANNDWVQISDAGRRIGWVRRGQIVPVGF